MSLLLVVLAVDAAWWTYQRYFSRALRITFLSVGQGDGAVLQFPGARVMLIDAGGSFSGESDPGERIVAPYLWSRKIAKVDYLVLSHPELDHFGGFSYIARNFHPSEFWTINATSPDIKYEELLEILAGGSVRLHLVDSSMPARLIGGVRVIFLNPQPQSVETRNNSSMVLALEFGSGRVLFTGDLEAKGERLLLEHKAELRATVLKVPHHGSKTSSSAAFVEAVSPRYAVISLGYHNRYHFPSGEVLDRYHQAKAEVLRTDQVGAVMAEFTRQGLTIWTARDGSGSGIVPAP